MVPFRFFNNTTIMKIRFRINIMIVLYLLLYFKMNRTLRKFKTQTNNSALNSKPLHSFKYILIAKTLCKCKIIWKSVYTHFYTLLLLQTCRIQFLIKNWCGNMLPMRTTHAKMDFIENCTCDTPQRYLTRLHIVFLCFKCHVETQCLINITK